MRGLGVRHFLFFLEPHITEMTDFERAQRSASPVLQPLNVVNGDYANYPDYQAQDAVAHANG